MQQEEKSGNIFDLDIIRRLVGYMKPYGKWFILQILMIILAAAVAIAQPVLIQKTIDEVILTGNYEGLNLMMLAMVGALVTQALLQYSQMYLSGWLGQNIIRDIRVKLYEHILKLRIKFFDNTPVGRLITRTISDLESMSDVFTEGLAAIAGDILQLIFIIGAMFYTDWRLSLVSLSMIPLLLLSTYVFKEKIKKVFNEVRVAISNLNTFVQEHITGMNIVQIFNAENREFNKFKVINREHRRANIKSVFYYAVYFPVADVIGAACIGLLVWYGTKQVLGGSIQLGVVTAFILYINMFFRPIRMLADRFNTLQMGIVSTDRIAKLLDSQEFITNHGTLQPERIQGDVSFENVWFAYNEENYVLKNISFEVKQGETLAIVGATGAGKSSTINLLSRLYEINQGNILVDGVNIKGYELGFLRRKIGVVLQDVFLFSGSIFENITLGNPDIKAEQVYEAARLVGANRFIERLPGAYNYDVMERGATLSVGQRQLISFVRAMVYNPSILVLDEATASVDSETEEMIQEAIKKLMKGRTSIVIAHRLSTIQDADKIMVLDKGEVKEIGSHEELLRNKEGFYTQLYRMQYANNNVLSD
jgi:ATP-binding cassette, subfamily B, multidrug efflux pump